MRLSPVLPSALALALLASSAAQACDPVLVECLPAVTLFPAYTSEGIRVGTVAARVRRGPRLEIDRSNGQPRTVVFNDPTSVPGAIDPYVTLVPLPRAPRFHTQAVYPRGY